MSNLSALQTFVNRVLSEAPAAASPGDATVRFTTLDVAVGLGAAPSRDDDAARLPFTAFIPEHTRAAVVLAQHLGGLVDRGEAVTADGAPTETLIATVRAVAEAPGVPREDALVRHAVKLFTTHHPVGRLLEVQPLEVRAPLRALTATTRVEGVRPPHADPPEDQLDWFRGDPDANDHHDHWHVVYPNIGLPVGDGEFKTKDRQGELFLYMHQQMLARYEAERLATGLPPVIAYEDYRKPIAEAYDPGDLQSGTTRYTPRPAETPLVDLLSPTYRVVDHERRRERAVDAVDSGFVRHQAGTLPLNSDLLGATLEESIGTPDTGGRSRMGFYGNFHGMGHVLSAMCTDPSGKKAPGVMYDTATAIRDPFFWQWHRHIDDYYFRWQERLPAHSFSDAPDVAFRDATTRPDDGVWDLVVATAAQVEAGGGTPAEYGAREFGGDRWGQDFGSGERSTDTLTTRMLRREFELAPGENVEIEYLYPDDFYYFIRVENLGTFASRITLRIFVAPEQTVDNRRTWIEMDKFDHQLEPGERAVIARSSRDASVVRKPVVPPGTTPPAVPEDSDESYCRCGWPYGLLVPRGTKEGMPFRLFVMATDWNQDRVRQDSCCGSFSYCGAQDFYPDRRPMGYPFDRPLPPAQGSFDALVRAYRNFASRPLTITWAE